MSETPLTVGDIRRAMDGLDDDAQAFVSTLGPDLAVTAAYISQQIPHDRVAEWSPCDPLVFGLELSTESFPVDQHRWTGLAREIVTAIEAITPQGTPEWVASGEAMRETAIHEIRRILGLAATTPAETTGGAR